MTIPAAPTEIAHAGDGVTLAFAISFVFDTSADIKVISTAADGTPTQITTGFSITGGGGSTGTCTFLVAPAALTTITLLDDPELTQTADYIANDAFPADAHEAALDRTVRQVKRLAGRVGRSIRVADGDNSSGDDLLLPIESTRASKFLAFDVDGQPIASAGTGGGDSALRTDLASQLAGSDGARLIGRRRSETGAIARSLTQLLDREMYAEDFGLNTVPGTTDMAAALQAAIDATSARNPRIIFTDILGISKPLLVRTSTQQGLSFHGASKPIAILQPNAVDIKQSPQNVNCCIFNQNNNTHLQLINMRFFSAVGFTGVAVYCKEGGGADASGECLFSPIIRDLFVAFSSTNSGFLTGALQNGFVQSNTFESMKGCFTIEGVGHADVGYENNSLFACFDHFINQVADTNGSALITVNVLRAYAHMRGFLFDVKNWDGCSITTVLLEPDAANFGTVGIGKFTDCKNLILSGLIARVRAGVPAGETILEFAGAVATSAKISNATMTGNRAVKISATGAVTLEFNDCDFSTAGTNCFDMTGAASTGTIITRNCKFNDAQVYGMVHTAAVAVNWYSYGDEFINAGLGGNAASRCIAVSSSGEIILNNPKIGRTSGGAAAVFFIEAGGAGTVKIIHPTFLGTAPTGIKTGAQEVQIIYKPGYGANIASAASITIPNEGDVFLVTGVTNIVSISAGNMKGRRITLIFAGVLTLTDGSNLLLAGNFVTTADDSVTLVCDGTSWFETGRSVN